MPRSDSQSEALVAHVEFVRRLAASLVRDRNVAEEVAQETLLAALQGGPSSSPQGLRSWLAAVLRNKVSLHFRTETRRASRELRSHLTRGTPEDAARAVEFSLMQAERTALLGKALQALREPYRSVVVLRYLEELSPPRIAAVLQRPVATVNTQLQRGLQILRTELDRLVGGDRQVWATALMSLAAPALRVSVAPTVGAGAIGIVAASLLVVWTLGDWSGSRLRGTAALDLHATRLAQQTPTEAAAIEDRRVATASPRSAEPVEVAGGTQEAVGATGPGLVKVLHAGHPVSGATVEFVADASALAAAGLQPPPILSVVDADGREQPYMLGPDASVTPLPSGTRIPYRTDDAVRVSTDTRGVAEIPPSADRGDRFVVTAPGYRIHEGELRDGRRADIEVDLWRAAELTVRRNGFAEGSSLSILLTHEASGETVVATMVSDALSIDFPHLRPGTWRAAAHASALRPSDPLRRYESEPLQLPAGSQHTIALDGVEATDLEVLLSRPAGASVATRMTLFRDSPRAGPSLEQQVPIVDGRAVLRGVAPGPIVLLATAQTHSLRPLATRVLAGQAATRIDYPSHAGQIRVVHPPGAAGGPAVLLCEATGTDGAWRMVDTGSADELETTFHDLEPGHYLVWSRSADGLRAQAVDLDGGAVEARLDATRVPTGRLTISAGPGIDRRQPVYLIWRGVFLERISLDPSLPVVVEPGDYELQFGLDGLGTGKASVTVTGRHTVDLTEPAPRRHVLLQAGHGDANGADWLIFEADATASRAPRRLVAERFDASSVSCALRPGRYVVERGDGRRATFDLGPGQDHVQMVWSDSSPGSR